MPPFIQSSGHIHFCLPFQLGSIQEKNLLLLDLLVVKGMIKVLTFLQVDFTPNLHGKKTEMIGVGTN